MLDPFDPRVWPLDLPYRAFSLSDRDDSLFCIIDEVDYQWALAHGPWLCTHRHRTKRYAARSYAREGNNGARGVHRLMWLHKEILLRTYGPPPTEAHFVGDHLNGNSLDNRRRNLRWATEQENNANRYGLAWRQYALQGITHDHCSNGSPAEQIGWLHEERGSFPA